MKLSFSTRGWAGMTWNEWVQAATSMHFNGIEVYNPIKTSELMAKDGPLHKYSVAATVRQLRAENLEIPCFDTYIDLAGKAEGLDEDTPFEAAHRLAEETEVSIPKQVAALETMPVLHKDIIAAEEMAEHIKKTLGIVQ